MTRRPDVPTLVAGVAIAALGGLLLVDDLGGLDLRFGLLAPACLAVVGAILLASGLGRRP
ncbi:MAG TPA: hypothetical protein VLA98_08445 [Solirubrobacteraceae bacterium]|nr:hypothetical protein [Solirubrobacteraceae bacterium]HSD80724.1 hypothetical protein [Solirubrobacteraceae bacterium]